MAARGVMCDIRQSRVPRRPLVSAVPTGERDLVVGKLGSGFQSERMCFRYREFTV